MEVQERTVAPYSTMDVTVRAHTHWGGGAAARAQLHSPQAVPSTPRKPRVYMQHVQRYYTFRLTVEACATISEADVVLVHILEPCFFSVTVR